MFPVLKYLKGAQCPDWPNCDRSPCLFSHEVKRPEPIGKRSTSDNLSSSTPPAKAPRSSILKKPGSLTSNISESRSIHSSKTSSSSSSLLSVITSSQNNKNDASKVLPVTSRSTSRSTPTPSSSTLSNSSHPKNTTAKSTLNNSNTTLSSSSSSTSTSSRSDSASTTVNYAIPPKLLINPMKSHTNIAARQKVINLYHTEFARIYSQVDNERKKELAHKHALDQELNVYSTSGKAGYRSASGHALMRLRKRPVAQDQDEIGTNEEIEVRKEKLKKDTYNKMTIKKISHLVLDLETMKNHDYITEVPQGEGGNKVTEEGNMMECERCKSFYTVKAKLSASEKTACHYHSGRVITEKNGIIKNRIYTCCRLPEGAMPCEKGVHVFKDESPEALHSRVGFVDTQDLANQAPKGASPLPIVALDCELVYTTSGLSLARVTVVDDDGVVLVDELINPIAPIIDHITSFSGIKPGEIEQVECTLVDIYAVRKILAMFVGPQTVIIGHGLENDLKALRLVHNRVIDTAAVYPHRLGLPFRNSLKLLTQQYLKTFIQDGSAEEGHDSKTDAVMALNLVRYKMHQDEKLK